MSESVAGAEEDRPASEALAPNWLQVEGECIDLQQLKRMLRAEVGRAGMEHQIVVSCSQDDGVVVELHPQPTSFQVSLSGLSEKLKERTLALAIAEATARKLKSPQPVGAETTTMPERDSAPPASPENDAVGEELPKDEPPVDLSDTYPVEFSRQGPEFSLLLGAALRSYSAAPPLYGGSLELGSGRWGWFGQVLVRDVEGAPDSINLSGGGSYAPILAQGKHLGFLAGLCLFAGLSSARGVERAHVGSNLFAAGDWDIGSRLRTRLRAELGHVGWSSRTELEQVHGLFVGATWAWGLVWRRSEHQK